MGGGPLLGTCVQESGVGNTRVWKPYTRMHQNVRGRSVRASKWAFVYCMMFYSVTTFAPVSIVWVVAKPPLET